MSYHQKSSSPISFQINFIKRNIQGLFLSFLIRKNLTLVKELLDRIDFGEIKINVIEQVERQRVVYFTLWLEYNFRSLSNGRFWMWRWWMDTSYED